MTKLNKSSKVAGDMSGRKEFFHREEGSNDLNWRFTNIKKRVTLEQETINASKWWFGLYHPQLVLLAERLELIKML